MQWLFDGRRFVRIDVAWHTGQWAPELLFRQCRRLLRATIEHSDSAPTCSSASSSRTQFNGPAAPAAQRYPNGTTASRTALVAKDKDGNSNSNNNNNNRLQGGKKLSSAPTAGGLRDGQSQTSGVGNPALNAKAKDSFSHRHTERSGGRAANPSAGGNNNNSSSSSGSRDGGGSGDSDDNSGNEFLTLGSTSADYDRPFVPERSIPSRAKFVTKVLCYIYIYFSFFYCTCTLCSKHSSSIPKCH